MSSQNEAGPSGYQKSDPGWKYNYLVDPKDKNSVTCKFCKKVTNCGIYRAKTHQIGGNRNVRACNLCPKEVQDELRAYMNKQKLKKTIEGLFDVGGEELEDEDVLEIPSPQNKRKKINVKGPMDLYVNKGKGKKVQTSIHDTCDKEIRGRTIQAIAAFF
ncbi:uncharacterized protein LOC110907140 [Helianthus annuus]|uniref:uncharacterized protein LOC110907140 n=1 Tax=Helianthus annuus TaxID=4232 RepID=UPI000B902A5E|nr:uncharacterized protein LOC110907140 [Helianthus annuus]